MSRSKMMGGYSNFRSGSGRCGSVLFPNVFSVWKRESVGHPHQVGERACAKLLHDIMAVNLDGDLADSNLSCDLLVHQAGSYQAHHLLLAMAQEIESNAQLVRSSFIFSPLAITVQRSPNGVQQILLSKWLGEELDCSCLHGLH